MSVSYSVNLVDIYAHSNLYFLLTSVVSAPGGGAPDPPASKSSLRAAPRVDPAVSRQAGCAAGQGGHPSEDGQPAGLDRLLQEAA